MYRSGGSVRNAHESSSEPTPGKIKAHFIEPMDCLPVAKLPEGALWTWEIKLDGWRMEVVKTGGRVTLYSRRGKNFNAQVGYIARELAYLPDETVIDGELVAVDEEGRPSFNLLQNFRCEQSRILYYVFDVLVYDGNDLMRQPLSERREVLRSVIRSEGHVGISEVSDRPLAEMIKFTQAHGLEGIVAKRADSSYQSGLRTGSWSKYRFNRSQEFVVGGYVPSHLGIDSLVVGVYRDKKLYYAARVRAGFVPVTRRQVFEAIKHLTAKKCPFVNLPQKEPGRWGVGLTAEKMTQCVWHTKFIRLGDDKTARRVVRET